MRSILPLVLVLSCLTSAQRVSRYPRTPDRPLVASFQGLGDLPGGAVDSIPRGISPDGAFIVGASQGPDGKEAFVWTATGGMQGLGDLDGGAFESEAKGVASYGRAIVGYGSGPAGLMAFRWTPGGGMRPLGDLPGGPVFSLAIDVSADGARAVGYSSSTNGTEGFLWEKGGGGLQGLGDLPGGVFACRALRISAFGNRIVGDGVDDGGARAVYWDLGAPPVSLPGSGGLTPFFGSGVNHDGNVIVGSTEAPGLPPEAFRWNGSATQNLGLLPYQTLNGIGTSATGRRVVGSGYDGSGTRAWLWEPGAGVRDLRDVLENEYGLDLGTWQLDACTDISGDGQRIIGFGTNPSGHREAFQAVLPISCRADLNHDGVVNLADLGIFSQAHAQSTPVGDFDGDGFVNDEDVLAFIAAYRRGC